MFCCFVVPYQFILFFSFRLILSFYCYISILDIRNLLSNNDIQTIKKIIFIKPNILSNNLSNIIKLLIDHKKSNLLNLFLQNYPHAVDITLGGFYPTPLSYTVSIGFINCVNILLKYNANVDERDFDNDTCLHIAAYCGHYEITKILLQHGVDINRKGSNGGTPLMIAVRIGKIKIVKQLLQHNADVHIKDNDNNIGTRNKEPVMTVV